MTNPWCIRFENLADTLLDLNSSPGEMLEASQLLHESLMDLSEWDEHSADVDIETKLDTGIAIAPFDAAWMSPSVDACLVMMLS